MEGTRGCGLVVVSVDRFDHRVFGFSVVMGSNLKPGSPLTTHLKAKERALKALPEAVPALAAEQELSAQEASWGEALDVGESASWHAEFISYPFHSVFRAAYDPPVYISPGNAKRHLSSAPVLGGVDHQP